MKKSFYREHDYTFGQTMLNLRTSMELTQIGLAQYLGVSRKAIGRWEAGEIYPNISHMKALLTLAVRQQVFGGEQVEEQIRTFWQTAHQKVHLDEHWLSALLDTQHSPSQPTTAQGDEQPTPPLEVGTRVDWGEAQAIPGFYGRTRELLTLSQSVIQERTRVVSILGLGGIGKSALAINLMHQVAPHFEAVIWRSLRDAPGCEALLNDCLQFLASQTLRDVSLDLKALLALLLEHLRRTRVLLVLDNLESVLEEGVNTGQMRAGYEGYSQLLQRLAEIEHQSCLLLTSREKPIDLIPLEGIMTPVRTLRLTSLDGDACQQLLAQKGVTGSTAEQERLIEAYAGNPLALNIVAQTISDLFAGHIAPFLEQGEVIFGGVRALLAQQFTRLTSTEQTVLLWLAIVREPITIERLLALLTTPLSRSQVLEAIETLHRRSLIERGQQPGSFTLQSVVLEYATEYLIAEMAHEIQQSQPVHLIEHGMELATVKEYVRQTQQRLLITPLLARVRTLSPGETTVEERLLALLNLLRDHDGDRQGYGPANLLALLREQRGHLRNLDLSRLTLREAFLQGIELQDSILSQASLRETAFNDAFDIPWSVATSRNGHYWAMGTRRGEVCVWRDNGKTLHLSWQAHTDTVRALAFHPDGRELATGSWDGSIKLWDIEHGTLLWTRWLSDNVECLAFAPAGDTLACGGDDGIIYLWETTTGTHRLSLNSENGPIFALAWSPDGCLIASGGVGGVIQFWDLQKKQPEISMQQFTEHTNWVLGLAFAPDGKLLASASWDHTVKLWDVQSRLVYQTLSGHTDRVRAVQWSADGRLLASCGFDHTIWLWDRQKSSYRMGLPGHTAGIYDLAFTNNDRSLLSGGEDGTLRIWDTERGQCIHILQGYAVSLYDVSWNPNAQYLASAGSDNQVTIWDEKGLTPPKVLSGHRSLAFGVTWSPDGRWLASCGLDNAVWLWDMTTGKPHKVLHDPDHDNTLFFGIAWSPDGTHLASASYQQGIHVWNTATFTRQWVSQGQQTRIRRVAWNSNGTQLASCGDDGSVCLWEATNGKLIRSLKGQAGMISSIAWSPDGTRLASGSGGKGGCGEITIWEIANGERLRSWSDSHSVVFALAWSPTEAQLLSGGSDGNLRWWDTVSGECLRTQKGHQGAIQALCVSPDGDALASCGDDHAIRLWNLKDGLCLQTLRHDRPYERLNISGIKGLTQAQKATLLTLGAIETIPES